MERALVRFVFQLAGDARQRSRKDKRLYFRETVLQSVNKLQQQPAVDVHRSRDVTKHDQLRALWPPLLVTQFDQFAAGLQRQTQRASQINSMAAPHRTPAAAWVSC